MAAAMEAGTGIDTLESSTTCQNETASAFAREGPSRRLEGGHIDSVGAAFRQGCRHSFATEPHAEKLAATRDETA
jgi:hypothetical protein